MDTNVFIEPLIQSLREQYDAKRHERAKGYYPSSMEIIGVTNQGIKAVYDEYMDAFKALHADDQWAGAIALCNAGIFEAQQLGYMLLNKSRKAMTEMNREKILAVAGIQDNWVSVDSYSVWFSGKAWRLGHIDDDEVMGWCSSEDRWIRRKALVSTVSLNQKSHGGAGDTTRTMMVCKALVADRDDMVVKALSWALRELSKRDRESVIAFMDQYKDQLAARVRREVGSKLSTGKKNPGTKRS